MDPGVPYSAQRVIPSNDVLTQWMVDVQAHEASGPCPRCGGMIQFDWVLEFSSLSSGEENYTRKVVCNCGDQHANTPKDARGCGAYFVATFSAGAGGDHVEPTADSVLINASLALATVAGDAESRIRNSAEKWAAGITSLIALFGIATSATGGKLFDGVTLSAREHIIKLTLAAIASAIVAIIFSSLAAHGWPSGIAKMNDERLKTWYEGWTTRLDRIGTQFRIGLGSAVVSIILLTTALAIQWTNPSQDSATKVKATSRDDAMTCGALLTRQELNTIRIRISDGTVRTLKMDDLVRLEPQGEC